MGKRIAIILGAAILVVILLASLGATVGLAVALLLVYFGWRQATLTDSTILKLLWWIVLAIGVIGAISSLPGIIGLFALYLLIKLYEGWKEEGMYSH